jgi:antitoxin component of RelBE/YafQ-DinJ toxin-antitoxin module
LKGELDIKQVNVRLDEQLIKEVKKLCLEMDITFQDAVSNQLKEWIKEEREQQIHKRYPGLIKENNK